MNAVIFFHLTVGGGVKCWEGCDLSVVVCSGVVEVEVELESRPAWL